MMAMPAAANDCDGVPLSSVRPVWLVAKRYHRARQPGLQLDRLAGAEGVLPAFRARHDAAPQMRVHGPAVGIGSASSSASRTNGSRRKAQTARKVCSGSVVRDS